MTTQRKRREQETKTMAFSVQYEGPGVTVKDLGTYFDIAATGTAGGRWSGVVAGVVSGQADIQGSSIYSTEMASLDVFAQMKGETEQLKARVAALEGKVKELEASLSEEQVVVLRTIDREQAKREIYELFQSGGTLFYSDIARRLRIDLPLVVEICQELEESGEIGIDANAI